MLLLSTFLCSVANGQRSPVKTFPLEDVRLQGGPFYHAQELDLKYLLALDPDRLLVPFLREAGISTTAESYGNWENTGLDGHIGGHYLTALSLMYASTGNAEIKKRLDYMVEQLAKCQDRSKEGYVGGIPGGAAMWLEVKSANIRPDNFSLNGKWVPLYNIHKLYAGLRDAYQIGKNDKAKVVFIKLCDWFLDLTSNLSDEQIQQMLRSEHGGMNEVFADAAEMTGDNTYMVMARKLSHRFILNPLLEHKDVLTGLHANTQIPKVIGYKRIADLDHDAEWGSASEFFWETVVTNRSVSIGGNSVREHFNPADDFSSMIESNQGPETCNTYNMLRLTKALYLSDPKIKYMDYYERGLYNHILSSQNPVSGGLVYFTPMRPRHYRVYSSPQESFWCCVGSGIENHGKYGELIYAHTDKELFVNLFISSQLTWREKDLELNQKTDFPFSETTVLTLKLKKSSQFPLNIRYPGWVKSGELRVAINGKQIEVKTNTESYVRLDRTWKSGDVITLTLPMHTSVEFLPDHSEWGSFVRGPIVMAAATDSADLTGLVADGSRMGHVADGKFYPIDEAPVMVRDGDDVTSKIKPVEDKPFTFTAEELIYPDKYKSIKLVPFFTIHDERYMIYWRITTPSELEEVKRTLQQKERDMLALANRTVDQVVVGEQQPEVEHQYKGPENETGTTNGKTWRNSNSWFSYEFQNKNSAGEVVRIVLDGGSRNVKFDLLVNDKKITTVELNNPTRGELWMEDFPIPLEMLTDVSKEKLTIKLLAHENARTGRVYQIMLLKRN